MSSNVLCDCTHTGLQLRRSFFGEGRTPKGTLSMQLHYKPIRWLQNYTHTDQHINFSRKLIICVISNPVATAWRSFTAGMTEHHRQWRKELMQQNSKTLIHPVATNDLGVLIFTHPTWLFEKLLWLNQDVEREKEEILVISFIGILFYFIWMNGVLQCSEVVFCLQQ